MDLPAIVRSLRRGQQRRQGVVVAAVVVIIVAFGGGGSISCNTHCYSSFLLSLIIVPHIFFIMYSLLSAFFVTAYSLF